MVLVFRLCTRVPPAASRALGAFGLAGVTTVISRPGTANSALAVSRPVAVRALKRFAKNVTDRKDRVSWVQIPAYQELPSQEGQQAPTVITLPHVASTEELISLYTDNST